MVGERVDVAHYRPRLCDVADLVHGLDGTLPESRSLQDFWRWRYSNLMDDSIKGDFAEWLVGTLLGLSMEPGGYIGGDNSDLRTTDGLTIEVKSTAYWQSWKLFRTVENRWRSRTEIDALKAPDDAKIQFGGLFKRSTDGGALSATAGFKSQIYVFAFQNEKIRINGMHSI